MRYNDRIVFIERREGEYNPNIGEYEKGIVSRETVPCFVMDLGLERSIQLFGDYEKERKVVYLRRKLTKIYHLCIYKEKIYRAKVDRQNGTVFYLEGDESIGEIYT